MSKNPDDRSGEFPPVAPRPPTPASGETPRTDTRILFMPVLHEGKHSLVEVVEIDFARRLERELAACENREAEAVKEAMRLGRELADEKASAISSKQYVENAVRREQELAFAEARLRVISLSAHTPSEILAARLDKTERGLAKAQKEISEAANRLHDELQTGGHGGETLRSIVDRAVRKYNRQQSATAAKFDVIDLWYEEFVSNNLCGLCGNRGLISTQVRSADGVECGFTDKPCICPNGRAIKKASTDESRKT